MAVLFIGRVESDCTDVTCHEDSSDWSPVVIQLYVISDKCYVIFIILLLSMLETMLETHSKSTK